MSEIIIPNEKEEQEELKYQATEKDEECFFLMYHMNMQPSEVLGLDEDYRKWLLARFVAQKSMEKEMMERHKLMNQINLNPKFV